MNAYLARELGLGDPVGVDDLAVQDQMGQSLTPRSLQRLAKIRGLCRQDGDPLIPVTDREQLDACNLKLTRYRALLDEGTDPAIVAGWIREVETQRLAIQSRLRTTTRRPAMTADEITAIVTALGDMIDVLARAEPADKIKIYTRPGLRMTHDINANAIIVTAHPMGRGDAGLNAHVRKYGVRGVHSAFSTSDTAAISTRLTLDAPNAT